MEKIINKNNKISNGTRKSIIFVLLVFSLMFVSTNIVSAYSFFGGFFGGRIINMKAIEIDLLENVGFICFIPGISISVFPIGSPAGTPTNYIIPLYVILKTRTIPRTGQLILGKYLGQTSINCIHPLTGDKRTVILDTISLYGTSMF